MWSTDQSWSFNIHMYELVFIIWGFSQSCQSSASESTTLLPVCETNLGRNSFNYQWWALCLDVWTYCVGHIQESHGPSMECSFQAQVTPLQAATKLPASHCQRNGSWSEFFEEPLLGLLTFWVASFESSVNYTKLFLIFKPSKNERPKFQSI